MNDQTCHVFREGTLRHFPGDPGFTACGMSTEPLIDELFPITNASMWCSACMKALGGVPPEPSA